LLFRHFCIDEVGCRPGAMHCHATNASCSTR
jgi:hypothetical protein